MQSKTIDKSIDFTQGKILGKLIKFIIPIIIMGFLQHFYNASDMIVVGNFSKSGGDAMGAIGSCSSLCSLFLNLFIGLAVGAGVVVSQRIGAKKFEDVKKIIDTSIVASLVCGTLLAIIVITTCEPILIIMGTPSENLKEAIPYIRAYFVGAPAILLYNFLSAIVRANGDTKTPLIILIFSGLVNVLTNILMVVVFNMGAVGVGIATAFSQYTAVLLIVIHMFRTKGHCKLTFKNFRFCKSSLLNIIKIGLPAGLQSVLFSISNVLIQSAINGYGNVVVNGSTAASNIEGFLYVILNSVYQGTLVIVGQNYGAKKLDRIKKVVFISIGIDIILGAILGLTILFFGDSLISIYIPNDVDAKAWGVLRLKLVGIIYGFLGIMELGSAFLRGMGKSVSPMIITFLGSCVFRVVWIYTVCLIIPNDYKVLLFCYPISWIISAIFIYLRFILVYKKEKRILEEKLI